MLRRVAPMIRGFFVDQWWPTALSLAGAARASVRLAVKASCRVAVLLIPLVIAGSVAYGGGVATYYTMAAVNQYRFDRSLSYPPSFAQAVNFARRMDDLADRFEKADRWGMRVSDESGAIQVQLGPVWQDLITNDPKLVQWAVEIVPYFEYEGLVDKAVYPQAIVWAPLSGMAHNHVLGQAQCRGPVSPGSVTRVLKMNYRHVNPLSPWNESRNPLPSIVHELAHFNGLCNFAWDLESATQVATLETLAAMANHGNSYALRSLVEGLRDFAVGYARSETYVVTLKGEPIQHIDRILPAWSVLEDSLDYHVDPSRWAAYDGLVAELHPGFQEQARREKGRRFWEQDPDHLFSIIMLYSRVPFLYMADAMWTTPPYAFSGAFPKDKLLLDDLAWTLEHLDQLVDEALR